MRIAITGATGLIGSAVAKRLSQAHEIVTIGRRAPADRIADFDDPNSVQNLDLVGCDAIVHCAGVVDENFNPSPQIAFLRATLGMAKLVERARIDRLARFAYISSAHVYGRFAGRIDELSPPNPLRDYAIAHFASEQILRRDCGPRMQGAVFRPCAVFGVPSDLARFRRWSLAPFNFVRDGILDGRITLRSSGEERRNYVGTGDIAAAVDSWLIQPGSDPFLAINPVGASSMSVFEFAGLTADLVARTTHRPCEVVRPEPSGGEVPFEYTTIDRRWAGEQSLEQSLLELARRIGPVFGARRSEAAS